MLHKADALVKSHIAELKERFGRRETLQYLLVAGAFVVVSHFSI
jgi:hypothetical protein